MDIVSDFNSINISTKPDSLLPATPLLTSLYPKIGKITDFIYQARKSLPEGKRIVALTGSAKLHGTHGDVVIENDGSIRFQSRNRLSIVPGKEDNQGFAAFASTRKRQWLDLKHRYIERFQTLNPDTILDGKKPVVIAGEWCGLGIMKGVAISNVPPLFVVFSVWIDGGWVLDEDYGDINCEEVRVFNISKAGFFHHDFDFDDIDASEAVIQALVEKVEKECPFGAALGIQGKGEGIVWKPRDCHQDPGQWFKTKGDSFSVSASHKLPPSAVAEKNQQRVENFARSVVSEQRLEQGWGYLEEMKLPQDMTGLGQFLGWVNKDVMAEEVREMEKLQIEKGPLGPALVKIAKPWFMRRVKREARLAVK